MNVSQNLGGVFLMLKRPFWLPLLAAIVPFTTLAGCGKLPSTVNVTLDAPPGLLAPAAAELGRTVPPVSRSATPSTLPYGPSSAAPTAIPTPVAPVSATPVPSASVDPDPVLTSQAIAGLVANWVTMSGDPKQPNDPADRLIPGDPINVVVVGSESQLDQAMLKAGWVHPAPIKLGSVIDMGWSLVSGHADPTAPVSNLYLFGRKQDLAWETNSADVHHRDHCRGWQTSLTDGDGQAVWLISGAKDIGVEWDSRRHSTTHKISPDIDSERDLIAQAIENAATLKRAYKIAGIGGGQPYSGKNGGGDPYQTDGMAVVLEF